MQTALDTANQQVKDKNDELIQGRQTAHERQVLCWRAGSSLRGALSVTGEPQFGEQHGEEQEEEHHEQHQQH